MAQNMYEMLEELEQTQGNIAKEDKIRDIVEQHPEAEEFFRFVYNKTVYGVSEKSFYNMIGKSVIKANKTYQNVSDLLYNITPADMVYLKETELYNFGKELVTLSGQEQINFMWDFFDGLNALQAKWWCRAILHDLRSGAGLKTINSVFKSLGLKKIKKFEMQLAKKLDIDDPKDVAKVDFPNAAMETKYDGIRIQAHVYVENEDTDSLTMACQLMSRRGTDRTSMHPEICKALCEKFKGQNVILDGELVADSFQGLTRKDNTSVRRYVIFDILNDESLHYIHRWSNLKSLLESVGITDNLFSLNNKYNNNPKAAADTLLLIAEHYNCNCLAELNDFYREMNKRGEEGVIIKLDNRPYKRGTRTNMFKLKKVFDVDLRIVGYKLGEGKRAGKVATLCLEDESGELHVDVGSGINDDTCEELTNQLIEAEECLGGDFNSEFIGKICEIRYNEISTNKDGETSLRFPRFVCIRDDKDEPDHLKDMANIR